MEAVEELKKVFKTENLTQIALRWILMFDAVSTVIPGASKAEYVYDNVNASLLPPLSEDEMKAVKKIYDTYIKRTSSLSMVENKDDKKTQVQKLVFFISLNLNNQHQ